MSNRAFYYFCTMLGINKGKKLSRLDFPKKIPFDVKSTKTGQNIGFFPLFSETTLTISMKIGQNVEEIDLENLAKTACQNFHRFQRYSTAKGRLGGPSKDGTRKIFDQKNFFCIFGI